MKRFSLIQALFLSCFSRDLYRDILLRWQGIGFSYLLLLNIILLTPTIIYLIYEFDDAIYTSDGRITPFIDSMIDQVASQIPPMEFKDGKMSTDVEQPHYIKLIVDEEEYTVAIIDTEATIDTLRGSDAYILLTKNAIHAKKSDSEIETRFWSDLSAQEGEDYFRLDAISAHDYAMMAADWFTENRGWVYFTFGVIGWAGTILVMFIYRAVQALIFGGAAMIVANIMKVKLHYEEAVRLACVAITPPILLDALFGLLLANTMSTIVFILLALCYICFAVHSNKEPA